MRQLPQFMLAIALAATILITPMTYAAGVVQMPFQQLVTDSRLAFEGRVIATRSAWNPTHTQIVTHVTFAVRDVLKGGPYVQVRLTFAGGSLDGQRMSVSGLRIPLVGEAGVYFVESTSGTLLSPILGWNQGQFLVTGNTHNARVLTSEGRPIGDFSTASLSTSALNEHQPSGLTLASDVSDAMPLSQFKSRIRQILSDPAGPRKVLQ